MLEKMMSNRLIFIPVLLSAVVGAVLTLAAGFFVTYQIVALIGNS